MSESLLEKQADLYRQSAEHASAEEKWKQDHDEAQLCLDVEELIALGLHLFDRINQRDERNRRLLFNRKLTRKKAAEWDTMLRTLLRLHVTVADQVIPIIEFCEERGYEMVGIQRYRETVHEARGMLTPDDEFFTPEKLAPMKAAALKEHRRGKASEMRRMGD